MNDKTPHSNSSFSSQAPSKWSTGRFPLKVKISHEFSDSETSSIQQMGQRWSTATASAYDFFDMSETSSKSGDGSLNSFHDDELGIYKSMQWPSELPVTALAVTQIFGMRRHIGTSSEYIEITHADILFNYQRYLFTHSGVPGTYDLPTVALHEIGHFLGLYHNNNFFKEQTVMQPSLAASTLIRDVYLADINSLRKIYPWSESSATQEQIASGAMQFIPARSAIGSPPINEVPTAADEPVHIIMELYPDGKCHHKKNNQPIHTHTHTVKLRRN